MLKSLFSVIVHEFIYDLQSHETILTGRLERKDAIAFSYKKNKKQQQQEKCATNLKATFQLVQKTVCIGKNADITFKTTIHKKERKKKIRGGKISALAELLK